MVGITAYGAYVPRRRLSRMAVLTSMGWFAPGLMMAAQGERAFCNWDEDALTLAVAAAKDCLTGMDKNAVDAEVLEKWRTPRTHNTRLGPEDGVTLDRTVVYILSGRILEDCDYGNRLMIDTDWSPGQGKAGYRIVAGCDKGGNDFHDSCFMLSWAA